MSTSVAAATIHSGKYSCAVASRVKSRGATGSPLKITVVTPAVFSRVIACSAVCWIVAGSSAYGITSASGAPASSILAASWLASSVDAALVSMYRSPNLRSVAASSSPAWDAGLPISCLLMNSKTWSCFCSWLPSMAHTYGARSS